MPPIILREPTEREIRASLVDGTASLNEIKTWLISAAEGAQVNRVRLLLNAMDSVTGSASLKNFAKLKALHAAVYHPPRDEAAPERPEIWRTPPSIQERYFEIVRSLVDNGAFDWPRAHDDVDHPRDSLLYKAIVGSTPRIVRFLCEQGMAYSIFQRARYSRNYVVIDALNTYDILRDVHRNRRARGERQFTLEDARIVAMRRSMILATFGVDHIPPRALRPAWPNAPANAQNSNRNSRNSNVPAGFGNYEHRRPASFLPSNMRSSQARTGTAQLSRNTWLNGVMMNHHKARVGNARNAAALANTASSRPRHALYVRKQVIGPNGRTVRAPQLYTLDTLRQLGGKHPTTRQNFGQSNIRKARPVKRARNLSPPRNANTSRRRTNSGSRS